MVEAVLNPEFSGRGIADPVARRVLAPAEYGGEVPALIFWRYFRARVDEYLLTLELAAERFARHLNHLRRA